VFGGFFGDLECVGTCRACPKPFPFPFLEEKYIGTIYAKERLRYGLVEFYSTQLRTHRFLFFHHLSAIVALFG